VAEGIGYGARDTTREKGVESWGNYDDEIGQGIGQGEGKCQKKIKGG